MNDTKTMHLACVNRFYLREYADSSTVYTTCGVTIQEFNAPTLSYGWTLTIESVTCEACKASDQYRNRVLQTELQK